MRFKDAFPSGLRPVLLPLALVALLAATLGFVVTRSVAGDREVRVAKVSVIGIPPTPTPPTTPEPSESPSSRSGRGGRDPRCPSGCDCQFPPGGTVVVCRGGSSLRFPPN